MNLIKYHNDINKITLGSFTDNETDIFFGILLKTKETEDNILKLNFTELKNLIDVKHRNNDRFIENVRGLNIKLKSLIQEIELPNGDFKVFSLFDDITTSPSRNQLEIEINKNFRFLIDGLMANYTEIDLKQLVSLRGNYSKILYRLLKQFETSKLYIVKIDDFRELMGIPSTYAMFNIRQKVLVPCMEQLKQYFQGLKLEEIKIGRNVSSLKFTWNKKEKKILKVNPVNKKIGLGEKELEKDLRIQKENEKIIKNIELEKIEISLAEYEELYQQHLIKLKISHNPYIRKAFDLAHVEQYKIINKKG
ncbi:MAG: replication initiation protein [Cetobacterium sp.]